MSYSYKKTSITLIQFVLSPEYTNNINIYTLKYISNIFFYKIYSFCIHKNNKIYKLRGVKLCCYTKIQFTENEMGRKHNRIRYGYSIKDFDEIS